MSMRTADRSVKKSGGTIKQLVLFLLVKVVYGILGALDGVIHHRIDTSVRASAPRRRKKMRLRHNSPYGKIKRLKCVRVKIKIVTVSRLSLFF